MPVNPASAARAAEIAVGLVLEIGPAIDKMKKAVAEVTNTVEKTASEVEREVKKAANAAAKDVDKAVGGIRKTISSVMQFGKGFVSGGVLFIVDFVTLGLGKLISGITSFASKVIGMVSSLVGTVTRIVQAAVATLTATLVAFGVTAIKNASEAENIWRKLGIVFGEETPYMTRFVKDLAKELDRSQTLVADFASSFGAFFAGLGMGGESVRTLTRAMTKLTFSFSTFNKVTDVDALRRFISALAGSGEVLDRYGNIVKEASVNEKLLELGLRTTQQGATQQERAIARLILILESMTQQGSLTAATEMLDLFRVRMLALQQAMYEFRRSVGDVLIQYVKPVVNFFIDALQKLTQVIDRNQDVLIKVGDAIQHVLSSGIARLRDILVELAGIDLTNMETGFRSAMEFIADKIEELPMKIKLMVANIKVEVAKLLGWIAEQMRVLLGPIGDPGKLRKSLASMGGLDKFFMNPFMHMMFPKLGAQARMASMIDDPTEREMAIKEIIDKIIAAVEALAGPLDELERNAAEAAKSLEDMKTANEADRMREKLIGLFDQINRQMFGSGEPRPGDDQARALAEMEAAIREMLSGKGGGISKAISVGSGVVGVSTATGTFKVDAGITDAQTAALKTAENTAMMQEHLAAVNEAMGRTGTSAEAIEKTIDKLRDLMTKLLEVGFRQNEILEILGFREGA